MANLFWIVIPLLGGALLASAYALSQMRRRLMERQTALEEAQDQAQQLEADQRNRQTGHTSTQDKLRSYLQLMDTVINTIPNPIYFKDDQGVFQGCNKVFSKNILGLTRDRIIGKRPQELPDKIPPDMASAYQRQEQKMMEKGGFHAFEAEVQCADNIHREYLFSLAPVMDQKGELSGSVAVLSDLTEKNRAAQDRMQKEKVEGVLETAGAVCHEFNQPLQALSGYIELLTAKLDPNETNSYISKINDQIERMRDITDKLQGITRYETMEYAGNTKIIDIHKASKKE